MSKKKNNNEWVMYPDVFEIGELKKLNMETKNGKFTEEAIGSITDAEIIEEVDNTKPQGNLDAEVEMTEMLKKLNDDKDVKSYYKVSDTLYIKSADMSAEEGEEPNPDMFKIFNPITGIVETRELTDSERKEFLVAELKRNKKTFRKLSHPKMTVGVTKEKSTVGNNRTLRTVKEQVVQTNVIVNKYGTDFKKKRKNKKKLSNASRKANR